MILKRIIQVIAVIVHNSYIPVFFRGGIYQGPLKQACTPILNCWGCPLAWYSCPMGALQHFVGLRLIPFYIVGFFGAVGMVVGRMSCGWVCPFGFLQDLLYKIHSFKLKLPHWCGFLKYIVLLGVALIIPYIVGEPWFCKLCPDGTLLAGVPVVLADATGDLRALVGWHFYMKVSILVGTLIFSVAIKRFFCRVFCPIGAIYSLFNRFSVFRIKVDTDKCIECESCRMKCPMDVPIYKVPGHKDCIRCLDCIHVCPTNALTHGTR